MKKTELYEIIKLKKPEPVHKTDEFLRGKGHDVLRLPPYHSVSVSVSVKSTSAHLGTSP
jgi:predicted homoserine dehydrogenase-like protein